MAGIACGSPRLNEPIRSAWDAIETAMGKGVLMFSPVGFGGGTIKICPPLNIHEEAMRESLDVLEESFAEVLAARRAAA